MVCSFKGDTEFRITFLVISRSLYPKNYKSTKFWLPKGILILKLLRRGHLNGDDFSELLLSMFICVVSGGGAHMYSIHRDASQNTLDRWIHRYLDKGASIWIPVMLTWKGNGCGSRRDRPWSCPSWLRVGEPWGFQVALEVRNLPASAGNIGDMGLIPMLGRPPGKGNDYPLQYSWLENSMDRGAWRAAVNRAAKSWTRLKWLSTHVRELCWNVRVHDTSPAFWSAPSPLFPPPPIPVTVCLRLPRLHPFLRSMVHPFIHGINTPPSSVPVLWEVRVTALNLQEELEEEARSQGRGSELQAAGAPGCSAQGHKAGTRVAAEPLKPGTSQPVLIPQTCRDQVRGTYHLPVWTSSTGTNFPRFGFCRVSPGPAVGALGLSSGQPGELLKGADSCLQGGSLAETMFHVLRKDRNRVESLPGAGVVELASWWVIMRRFERVVMRSHVVKSAREA